MPTEVKQRKKSQKPTDEVSGTSSLNGKNEAQKEKTDAGKNNVHKTSFDLRTFLCLLSLAACGVLSCLNNNINYIFRLSGWCSNKMSGFLKLRKSTGFCTERLRICSTWRKKLQQDIATLHQWASGLTDKRDQLQSSLVTLRDAVGQIEERTAAITKDLSNKVASVRTDVRRMDGLRSELDSLLVQVQELQDKANQVERSMVKRIGEVLADSIDRVSNLRAGSERNTQAIEQLRGSVPELAAAHKRISERLMELESGRARVIRTVTFASDLKPKVATIKRDFGALEPQLTDLVVRIGRLAEDLMKREQEIAELRQTLANLTAVEGDLSFTAKQVDDMSDIGEMRGSG
uniref:IKBKB interacting protein n=1 Tax=Takifugu rubripes TaxID=31033 RepID=A0A674MPT5_TAKRU